jgi:multisubunit Na+/H+ antiporter MnhC subunit
MRKVAKTSILITILLTIYLYILLVKNLSKGIIFLSIIHSLLL